MGAEEDDSVDRAAAERRERLRALKAAQELLNTPDDDAARPVAVPSEKTDGGKDDGSYAEGGTRNGIEDHDIFDHTKYLIYGLRNVKGNLGSMVKVAAGVTRETIPEGDSVGHAVAARAERLKALREAKRLLETPDGDTVPSESKTVELDDAEDDKKLNVKFRNYVPNDKQLQEHKLAPPVLPKFEDPIAANPIPEKIEDPFLNIAPKKPNWDLRRDVQKKLDKLEKRTQKAIYQLYLKQEEEKRALEENGATVEDV